MESPVVRVDSVTWTYPHASAPSLHELALSLAPGECVVLCGASGSGKSTALKLLNGLVPHLYEDGVWSGTVQVADVDTRAVELDGIGRVTGSVQQHPRRQFFTGTVPEELAFGLESWAFPPEEIRTRVAARRDALAHHLDVDLPLAALSGGQQQQVAIAASTMHEPPVLLLDEPSSNLSHDAIERLAVTLAELTSRGTTVVIAEHRLRYLQDVLDRVIVLEAGRIIEEWDRAAFTALSDEELEARGLRGAVRAAHLPAAAASGPSVAAPAPSTTGGRSGAGAAGADGPSQGGGQGPIREPAAPFTTSGVHGTAGPAGATASAQADATAWAAAEAAQAGTGLELRDVNCRIRDRTVLAIDHAFLPAGAVTALRGPNGAGKSTALRVIAGLRAADGEVRLHGRRLSRRARRGACAMVMQDVQRQLFTESVRAEAELAQVDVPRADRAGVDAVLAELDIAHLADRHPLSLSGGQQQRLVIAGARLTRRPVVIFDEPSSGVDRRHLQSITAQIRATAARGAVVLLVSHDEDLLAGAADQQITLQAPPA